jgi:hypothetical protein
MTGTAPYVCTAQQLCAANGQRQKFDTDALALCRTMHARTVSPYGDVERDLLSFSRITVT